MFSLMEIANINGFENHFAERAIVKYSLQTTFLISFQTSIP